MNKWDEYKQRKESQKYFRSQYDQFLSKDQWIKTITYGLLGSVVLGIIYGFISMNLAFDSSLFYIVIGIAIANILTSTSGVSSQQIGIASALLTLLSFYISYITIIVYSSMSIGLGLFSIGSILYFAGYYLVSQDLIGLIFIIIGLIVAYQQGSSERFM